MSNLLRNILLRGAAAASVAVLALVLTAHNRPATAAAVSSSYIHHWPG